MKLRIRYDNAYQTIVLNDQETEQLWVSLCLEGEGVSQKEKESRIQDAWEAQYNRPDYNSWHKFDRHRGFSKAYTGADDNDDEVDFFEPMLDEVVDDRIFCKDEIAKDEQDNYEAICSWVRKTLIKKPRWADAFIAVRIDGISVNDYAAAIGVSDGSIVSKWLKRAEKKLREEYPIK